MPRMRLTKATVSVLETLLTAADDKPAWGLSICNDTQLGSGTVYPILARLEDNGWIVAREETSPHPGRPARTFYELTNAGRSLAEQAIQAHRARTFRMPRLAGGKA